MVHITYIAILSTSSNVQYFLRFSPCKSETCQGMPE
jgi:hypothetical protein